MRILKSNYFLLGAFLLLGGIISAILKYDILWDFANYHYFNPWAFLNGRVGYDIGAAGLHGFFNPLMDIPLYLLIEYFNEYPTFICFMQGLWFGGLLFISFKIFSLYFDIKTWKGRFSLLLCLLIGASGWDVFMQIGTSSNEIPIALLVLISLYFLIKEVCIIKSGSWKIFAFCGFLLGAAMGLKLTAVTYCISGGLVLICFWKSLKNPLRSVVVFAAGGLAGFLVFNGFWMLKMWEMFQNPLFPFLNNIFHSEYVSPNSFSDKRFLPQNLTEVLFRPFIWFGKFYRKQDQMVVIDYRQGLLLAVFIGSLLLSIKRKILQKASPEMKFLVLWMFIVYVVWMFLFSISRYLVPFSMLSSLFLVKAFWYCLPKGDIKKIIYISFMNILLFQLLSTPVYSDAWSLRRPKDYPFVKKEFWEQGRRFHNGYDKFVKIENLNFPENTLILTYGARASFFLPYFAKTNPGLRMVMIKSYYYHFSYNGQKYDLYEINPWYDMRMNVLKNHQGPVVGLIVQEPTLSKHTFIEKEEYLHGKVCTNIYNNIVENLILCVPPELKESIFADRKGKSNVQ